MRIVRSEPNRSLRPASCWSVEVMNGGYGLRVYGFSSTEETVISEPVSASAMRRASASSRRRTLLFS
jgi:hypothetical protein